jgi:preprotein translocase subunit YajC
MAESLMLLAVVVISFYFILLRPVIQQQRRRRQDMSRLHIGDEVLTSGGFYAIVRDIQTWEHGPVDITLEVAPGVLLRGTPDAIGSITQPSDAPSSRQEKAS